MKVVCRNENIAVPQAFKTIGKIRLRHQVISAVTPFSSRLRFTLALHGKHLGNLGQMEIAMDVRITAEVPYHVRPLYLPGIPNLVIPNVISASKPRDMKFVQ